MKPIKKDDGFWHINIRPWGRSGKQIKRKFETKTEANQAIQHFLKLAANNKPWLTENEKDNRRLSELIEIWYKAVGVNLVDGVRCKKRLLDFSNAVNNPIARLLTAEHWVSYSQNRLYESIKPKTINNTLGYVKAVFNYLKEIGLIEYDNPILNIKAIKIKQKELTYLSTDQINLLLKTIKNYNRNPHVLLITKICLSTGGRWGESQNLKAQHIKNNSVTFVDTKNKKNRTIPISKTLFNELTEHFKIYDHFSGSQMSFSRALTKAGIKLPQGQLTHVLRHTFASHFMMNGGNILALQKILDHSDLKTTMIYAHLAPDYLKEAIKLNPLAIAENHIF